MRILLLSSVIAVATAATFWSGPWVQEKPRPMVVRIVAPMRYSSALMILADKSGLFSKNGLSARVEYLEYGKDCVEKMVANAADLSVAYLTPVVQNLNSQSQFKILTQLHGSGANTKILYRKDLILTLDDFYRQKIGLVSGTNAEFLLNVFASAKTLDHQKLKIVDLEREALEKQLLSGEISAAILWEPQAHEILRKHPDTISSFIAPFYNEFSVLLANQKFIDRHSEAVDAVFRALVAAQSLFENDPLGSHKIIGEHLGGVKSPLSKEPYNELRIQLGLSQLLKVMLSSEWEWNRRSSRGEFAKGELDDRIFDSGYLKKYLPGLVTLK